MVFACTSSIEILNWFLPIKTDISSAAPPIFISKIRFLELAFNFTANTHTWISFVLRIHALIYPCVTPLSILQTCNSTPDGHTLQNYWSPKPVSLSTNWNPESYRILNEGDTFKQPDCFLEPLNLSVNGCNQIRSPLSSVCVVLTPPSPQQRHSGFYQGLEPQLSSRPCYEIPKIFSVLSLAHKAPKTTRTSL